MTDGKYLYGDGSDMQSVTGFADGYSGKKEAFILPEQVKQIKSGAFEGCAATAFALPDGLEEIGVSAFSCCDNLEAVFIPKSVKTICNGAFEVCGKLTVYCEGEPADGWIAEEPRYEEQYVTTPEDYAFDFHRGGVSYTRVNVNVSGHWNRNNCPVKTNFPREEFFKIFNKFTVNKD